jgi:hypothetical protein
MEIANFGGFFCVSFYFIFIFIFSSSSSSHSFGVSGKKNLKILAFKKYIYMQKLPKDYGIMYMYREYVLPIAFPPPPLPKQVLCM